MPEFGAAVRRARREDFWHKVDRTQLSPGGCWLWTGSTNGTGGGYGKLKRDGRYLLAHRYAYEMTYGEVPPDLCLLHRCDVRTCVNPDHLFVGTRLENNRDCIQKGRKPKGEASGSAKLTAARVIRIRELYRTGRFTKVALAEEFQVSDRLIGKIVNGDLWKGIEPVDPYADGDGWQSILKARIKSRRKEP